MTSPLPLLVAAVGTVGVLHTIVPDHWAPIAVIARQRGWSRRRTAQAAAGAGLGHTLSTLAIGAVAWLAGAAVAAHFGHVINLAAGVALIGFGAWSAAAALRELRGRDSHAETYDSVSSRTALMLILGSSPSVEALPTFLAAAPLGAGALLLMALVFALTTIGTYVVTCVYSAAGLQRLRLHALERYGEFASGIFVMLIGLVFLFVFR